MVGWLNTSTVIWLATSSVCLVPVAVMVAMWWWDWRWRVSALKQTSSKLVIGGAPKLPPGNMGLPVVGELFSFLWYYKIARRPDDFIKSKIQRYGAGTGMFRTYLFGYPAIIACSPAAVKFVLQSDHIFPNSWPQNELMGNNSLIAKPGPRHQMVRKYVAAAINQPSALMQIGLQVQPRMIDSLRLWAKKGTVTVYDEVKRITFENIGKIFVSMEPGPDLENMVWCFVGLLKGVRAQPVNFPGSAYHYAVKCRKKLEEIFKNELDNRKNDPSRNEMTRNDLMGSLMQFKDDKGNKVKNEEVVDTMITLVVAGYEPTALASMWAIYSLAKYPIVLQKVREENMDIIGNKSGQLVTSHDMAKMKYTKKVVEETLRMASISGFIFRSGTEAVEFQGNIIPKGWKVLLWLRYLHYDPKNFEDPMCFNPERWDNPTKSGSFQVFGGGARSCIGNMLARAQLAIFIHHLVVGYKWQLVNPDAPIEYLPHPKPIDGVKICLSKI